MKPMKLLSSTIELTAELASLNSEFSDEDSTELVSVGEPTVTTTESFPLRPVSSTNTILYSKTPSIVVSTVHVITVPAV